LNEKFTSAKQQIEKSLQRWKSCGKSFPFVFRLALRFPRQFSPYFAVTPAQLFGKI